ncbi:Baicalein 7-O-glucuronosyltransferase [Vitis vinifera]|uniref:Baicalein 7-O-glucuronosyltransferase n=1 Tax=Vitis vinifera TaxID=29760 RepID=A0A438ICZ6_VITVI|nr:Baicalein 7-O-glucuronosyltransferase [Vitis vinifera]
MGLFSSEQLKEIATGLERSGVRFLWVVRMEKLNGETPQPSLDSCLPEGFLERTKDRGYLVKSWHHSAYGGMASVCRAKDEQGDLGGGIQGRFAGKALRDRVIAMRDGAKAAMREDGSSQLALAKLVELITRAPPT